MRIFFYHYPIHVGRKMKKTAFFLILASLCSCTRIIVPGTNETIILQQPVTREVFYCESDEYVSAAVCAAELEEMGFVRLTDKSVFPGKDDLLQKGSYPPRRYRDNQNIPRW